MRGLITLITILFSLSVRADIQQRISIFTQQTDSLKQICFLPDGTFLADKILFDPRSSIAETSFDCNAQALALLEEYNLINQFTESENCPADQRVDNQGLVDLLEGNSPIVEEIACPGIGSAEDCANKLYCNIGRSMFPAGAAVARYFSDHPILSSCDGTGTCLSNIGKAIFDNLWDTVTGMYDLGKLAVNWAGEKIGSLWRSENATSTRGIAATEITDAEADQSQQNMLQFMFEKGKQLINAISDGIKSRYGCAQWTGAPHISECVQPMSFECADCNQKLNMVCGVGAYIGANVISNFFTGGAVAGVQLTGRIAKATTFAIARTVPGGARLVERMSLGGRIGKAGSLIGGTIRAAWTGIKTSRPVQGMLSVAARVNNSARKSVFMYAQGQDATIALARGYYRLNEAAFRLGYTSTFRAADRTKTFLYGQFPRLSEITAGRYANVSNPEQFLRESTKNMSREDRSNMAVTVSTDGAGQRRVVVYDRRAGNMSSDVSFNFNPQRAPVPVARAVPENITDNVVEEIVVTARAPAAVSKDDYMAAWSEQVATTTQQNRKFIDEALRGEEPGLFYLDTQNTNLKTLNDTLKNKQLVDSLGNRYNAMVMEAVEEFRNAHPGVTVNFYSDYKSLRAGIRGPPGQEQELMEELARLMDRTNERFHLEVRRNNLANLGENEQWFRSGVGRTSEEANLVTRFSRRKTDNTTMTFNSIGAQTRIRESWQLTEQSRKAIQGRFTDTPMMRAVEGTDLSVPTADVLEVVRKNSDPDTISRILSGRYNRSVTRDDAVLLQTYFERVDQFSPGLLIPSRVEHRFEQATQGGFSVDFAGVGSVNAEATAIGLAQGQTVRDSLARVRFHETGVTRELDALKTRTENAVRNTLSRHGIYADITVSGDDMVVVPTRALTPEIRREIAEAQVAAQRGTSTRASGMRTSFFPEGIPDQASRSIQATIGESVEKKLRARLEGRLTRDELANTLFAVEMRGTSVGSGGVGLQTVNPNLSPSSRRIIEEELGKAIDDVNADLLKTGTGGSLNRESSFRTHFENVPLHEKPVVHMGETERIFLFTRNDFTGRSQELYSR